MKAVLQTSLPSFVTHYGSFTLTNSDIDTHSDLDSKPTGYCIGLFTLADTDTVIDTDTDTDTDKVSLQPICICVGVGQCEHTILCRTFHIAQIPTPYFCIGQESESESVSGNVNEPLLYQVILLDPNQTQIILIRL